jgi:hypothetical protein
MTVEDDRSDLDSDPVIELLPWYLSGTLGADERRLVTEHLATCKRCRAELGSLTAIGQRVREASRPRGRPYRRWAPAAAATVIVAQFGLLLWQRSPRPVIVSERSVAMATTRLRIEFIPSATELDIRGLVRDLHATFVGGPAADGTYLIEVPTTDPGRLRQTIALARSRPELVRRIAGAQP